MLADLEWWFRGTVVRVVDGDTVVVRFDCGFHIYHEVAVRLLGVLAPEIVGASRESGLRAKQYVEQLLPPGTAIQAQTQKVSKDKYGRFLATLYRVSDGLTVNAAIAEWLTTA